MKSFYFLSEKLIKINFIDGNGVLNRRRLKTNTCCDKMGGSLEYSEIHKFSTGAKYRAIKYFVETGTYMGDTTLMAAKHYEHVHTIEIHEGLYEQSKQRAVDEGVANVTFHLGDSIAILPEIVSKVKEGAVFFIDAHISGIDSGWNGVNRVPIMEELDIILSCEIGPSIIIIDDLRLWKQKTWDWSHVTTSNIVAKFKEHNTKIDSFLEFNDRLYILSKL